MIFTEESIKDVVSKYEFLEEAAKDFFMRRFVADPDFRTAMGGDLDFGMNPLLDISFDSGTVYIQYEDWNFSFPWSYLWLSEIDIQVDIKRWCQEIEYEELQRNEKDRLEQIKKAELNIANELRWLEKLRGC